jgi:outer membrane lipoprotein-sorting protein
LVPAALHAQSITVAEVMAALASAKSSRATFVETKTSSLLNAPLVTRGTLEYRRPDFLKKHVIAPRDEHIVLSGGSLTVQSGSRKRSLDVPGVPLIAMLVEGMLAVRAGDLASLEKHFGVTVSGQRQQWTMVLKPGSELAGYLSLITVSGLDSRIVELDVLEQNGDRAVMRISELVE